MQADDSKEITLTFAFYTTNSQARFATVPFKLSSIKSADLHKLEERVLYDIIGPAQAKVSSVPISQFQCCFTVKNLITGVSNNADSPSVWKETYLPELLKPSSIYSLQGTSSELLSLALNCVCSTAKPIPKPTQLPAAVKPGKAKPRSVEDQKNYDEDAALFASIKRNDKVLNRSDRQKDLLAKMETGADSVHEPTQ